MSYKFSKEELRELLIDYNEISLKDYDLLDSVDIWDETLRDGEQSPTVYLNLDEKIHLAKLMDEIGVKLIAVGFPAVSESEKRIVKTIVNENINNATILGIARPRKDDIDECIDADLKEIRDLVELGDVFSLATGKTIKEVLKEKADHLKDAEFFETVEDKTKRMVDKEIIPKFMINYYKR